jgi:sulfite reductase beta subunit-like hemoprotein
MEEIVNACSCNSFSEISTLSEAKGREPYRYEISLGNEAATEPAIRRTFTGPTRAQ